MKKTPLLLSLALLGASLFSFNAKALTVTKNNEPEFLVKRINIWKNEIELKYEDLDHSKEKIRNINIAWGAGGETKTEYPEGVMTERWRILWNGNPFWATDLYFKYRPDWFKNYSTITLGNSDLRQQLSSNPTNIIYYAVSVVHPTDDPYPEEEFWSGKVDYGPCVKSVDYKVGVECRAELVSGKPVYVPYTESGKRLRPAIETPEQPSNPISTPSTPTPAPISKPSQTNQAPSNPNTTPAKQTQVANPSSLSTSNHNQQPSKSPNFSVLALNNTSSSPSPNQIAKNQKPQHIKKTKTKSKTKVYPSVPVLGRKTKSLPTQIILLPPLAALSLLFLFFLCRKKDQKDKSSKED